MKKKKTLIGLIALALVMVVGIGFAAFQNALQIDGTVTIAPNTSAFKVVLASGTGNETGVTVDASAETSANISISSAVLTTVGDSTTVKMTIENASSDAYDALVGAASVSYVGDAGDYITVTCNWTEKTLDYESAAEEFTVIVELKQAVLTEKTVEFTIKFDVTAQPAA